MRVLIQRVRSAAVHVDDNLIGQINQGLLAFVGLEPSDNSATLSKMANKLLAYRVFNDVDGKMNLNVQQVNGGSQLARVSEDSVLTPKSSSSVNSFLLMRGNKQSTVRRTWIRLLL
ncbi:MAG: hypothetical protein EOO68_21420 [Moraxellaceae bacterium]|nr:MAG: hypothetical protein EOO68_21420 [Moraxellaceae bacterium]